ncbi:MAG: ABC transporter substrate-binding protein [Spirochaetaceae bacterium]|jgi:iron complex transport system substrate-binding protein|nr:ABC transporter substrate-binding protein [Spirochaetaceae bacterium]
MKRFFGVVLSLVFLLSFSACSKSKGGGASTKETRLVSDVWGREVEIPQTVETIICLGSGAPRMAAYLDVVSMMTGVEEQDAKGMTVLRDYSPVHYDAIKGLPLVGAGGGSGNNNGYPEEIIALAPDLVLTGFSREAADELQTQTGIPVVSVRYISNGLANETFYEAMRVFAEAVGAEERCEEILSFIDACKEDLGSRTRGIADGEKLKAYTGAVTFNGRHGFAGTYSKFGPFTVINALNVADEVEKEGYYETDLEKIVVWDPDVIFLDPGNMNLVNDEYATNPEYFKSLRAVREGRVYTMPSFNNMGMNISYALVNAYYAGKVLFPAQFADIDIAQKSAEILTFFLGENIYDAMAGGGLYYGTITIGD